jgi:hypothetical protein
VYIKRAAPIIVRFLMMYCPTRVGVNIKAHESFGSITIGKKVESIWSKNTPTASLVYFGNRNKIPIKHSKIPKSGINVESSKK